MFLVIANWKMNGSPALVQQYSTIAAKNCKLVVCPPYHLISSLSNNFSKGAQNCHWAESGAHTGEVSALMLKDLGAEYVILGHSERREAGETSTEVAKKASAAQNAGLVSIICVGEKEGQNLEAVVLQQLKESVPQNKTNIIIAYEPVWAIGTGRTPTCAEIEKAHALIKDACGLDVIYGGSVKPENTAEIAKTKGVSGLLVGGASLNIENFQKIIEAI